MGEQEFVEQRKAGTYLQKCDAMHGKSRGVQKPEVPYQVVMSMKTFKVQTAFNLLTFAEDVSPYETNICVCVCIVYTQHTTYAHTHNDDLFDCAIE